VASSVCRTINQIKCREGSVFYDYQEIRLCAASEEGMILYALRRAWPSPGNLIQGPYGQREKNWRCGESNAGPLLC